MLQKATRSKCQFVFYVISCVFAFAAVVNAYQYILVSCGVFTFRWERVLNDAEKQQPIPRSWSFVYSTKSIKARQADGQKFTLVFVSDILVAARHVSSSSSAVLAVTGPGAAWLDHQDTVRV